MIPFQAVAGRSRGVVLLVTVLFVFTELSSCASRDTAEVRSTVEHLMTALREGSRESVAALVPDMENDDRLEQVISAIAKYSSWSITEISRRDGSARAWVSLFADGEETTFEIPLMRIEGAWIVDSQISVTTKFDFVPRK